MELVKENKAKGRKVYFCGDRYRKVWENKIDWIYTHVKILNRVTPDYVIDYGNDYIRWGSKWEDVYRNFKICKDAGFDVNIGPTVQILNELYMPELRQWACNEGVDIFENILSSPDYYSIKNAPWRSNNKRAHNDFIKYTNILDNKRNCSIADYLPEVATAYGIS